MPENRAKRILPRSMFKLSPDDDNDAPTVVQPDITVTCDRSKLTEQGMTGAASSTSTNATG